MIDAIINTFYFFYRIDWIDQIPLPVMTYFSPMFVLPTRTPPCFSFCKKP